MNLNLKPTIADDKIGRLVVLDRTALSPCGVLSDMQAPSLISEAEAFRLT